MKILFCNFEYPPLGGGGGVINALLAEELASRHEVTILTSQGLDLPFEEEVNGVRVIRVPVYFRRQKAAANMPSMLAYVVMGIRVGKKLLKNESFDVINTHFVLPSGPVGDALSAYAGLPNVLSVHGGDLYDPSKFSSPHRHSLLRMWIKRLLGRADAVVGQSNNTLENMHSYYTSEIKGIKIPLGIRRPGSIVSDRKEYGFDDTDIVLVTVGRLVGRKAIDQLIIILNRIGDANVHLLIVGSGPLEDALREKAVELNIDKQVHFMGFVQEDEKFRLLNISDVFVSTSQHEGFGIVYLEAMAMGLPVICYDCGGQTDFLDNEETGYVLPLNDTQAFYEACVAIIGKRDMKERMQQENVRRVGQLYIDSCAERYEEVFNNVINECRDDQLNLPRKPDIGPS